MALAVLQQAKGTCWLTRDFHAVGIVVRSVIRLPVTVNRRNHIVLT